MVEATDLKGVREMREIQKLLAEARGRHGGIPEFNGASLEIVEIITFLSHEDSGIGSNLNFLFCAGSGQKCRAVGIIRLTPDQWKAVRESGDDLFNQMEKGNPPDKE